MRPRRQRARRSEIPPEAVAWLTGAPDGERSVWLYFESPETLASLWAQFGAAIVEEHVARRPGTRPLRWWQYDAPEPRRRLGGTGTAAADVLAHVPRYSRGLPMDWITRSLIETYRKIGRPLDVPALDPDDPPIFESEAAYLDRLELLTDEERALIAHFPAQVRIDDDA